MFRRLLGSLPVLGKCALTVGLAGSACLALPVALASAEQGGFADSVQLTGLVTSSETLTLNDLQAMPSITKTVAFGAGNGFEVETYTGVALWDILQADPVVTDSSHKNDLDRKYIVATGSDGYEVVYSMAELEPDLGGEDVLIAYERDGQPLGPDEGMARIVNYTDKRGARLVSNLVRLEVRDIDSPPRTS